MYQKEAQTSQLTHKKRQHHKHTIIIAKALLPGGLVLIMKMPFRNNMDLIECTLEMASEYGAFLNGNYKN